MMGKITKHQGIPLDVVHGILVYLPVKTLKRFQCVSKSWCSLICSPPFQQDHYVCSSQQNPFLLITKYKTDRVSGRTKVQCSTYNNIGGNLTNNFSILFSEELSSPIWTLSCKELVCIHDYKGKNILCNPSTREVIYLPPSMGYSRCLGFGYAASTKEFKVVNFFSFLYPKAGDKFRCQIFTLGTSEWREVRCPHQGSFGLGAPFLHGAIHVLPNVRYLEHYQRNVSILAFDIQSEKYNRIALPEPWYGVGDLSVGRGMADIYLTKLGGSLCLTFDFNTSLGFWLLKDYVHQAWVKEYSIDLTSLGSCVCLEAVPAMVDGSEDFFTAKRGEDGLPCYYNPRDEPLAIVAEQKYSGATWHVESLLALVISRT